uniref:CAAX prenyl protease 2/Lysostaphin resistance protein A-like domain-containing protein n=1 Tax=Oryza punctata TaxID=4537 RepID=A0A0E0KZL0_ORYPU
MAAVMLAPAALPLRGWKCRVAVVATWKRLHSGPRNAVRIFAAKSNERRRRRRKSQSISQGPTLISEEASSSGSGENPTTSLEVNANDVASDEKFAVAPRNAVLQACTLTSSLLLAGGLVLREASHFASLNGWPVADPMNLSFNFETWHPELIAGLTWPDFRNSSETANRQEVLFRGALMPIFGLNWISAFVTGAIFGILHLGNGRKYSFAIWATFVGIAYGLATIASSSIIHFSQTGGNL